MINCWFHQEASKEQQVRCEGPGPAPLEKAQLAREHSSLSVPWAPVLGKPVQGKFQCPSELMGSVLPSHCQCGQHLWLQDLPPTVGALWDPSERPLWTEEKRRKTQFSQEKQEVGESGTSLFPCLETQVPRMELHVAYGQMLGSVPFHRPLTSLLWALKLHPSPPPPPGFFSHITPYFGQLVHTYYASSWTKKRNFETISWLIQTRDILVLLLNLTSSRKSP